MIRHAFVMGIALCAGVLHAQEQSMWERFNWGIHAITIPAVFLVGLIAGWLLRERKVAEERAREEIAKSKQSPKSGSP